jgi:hypothetical protein
MMNAYELAKQLEERHAPYEDDAANMLRQQADRIAELEKQTKPLSDEEINKLIVNKVTDYELCRAIEERHGIK